jgi:hypothetical protein
MSTKKRPFIIFIQVALLSIFIISAFPIPPAEAGWSDLVKKELFKQPRTLKGVVFLDNDISNATVSIYDLSGSLLHVEQNATAKDGSFAITCPLPESFKIVVTGGSLGGESFSHEVVRIIPHFYEWDEYKVNAITTLMARYQDRHPEMSYSQVTEAVENFLSIPDDVDISDVIYSTEWFSYHFSHYLFMKEAEANGGMVNFIDQLLNEMDGGNIRSFYASESASSSLFQDLFKSLLEGAASQVGGAGAGWILGLLNLGGGDDTDARLEEMSDKLDEVLSDLQNIISALNDLSKQLALDTNKVEQYIEGMSAKDAISAIKTHYDQEGTNSLMGFAKNKYKDKSLLQNFVNNINGSWDIQNQVTRIHDAIISQIGGTEELLELWTGELILKSPASDDQLMQYYKTLENYFSVLLFYQFKGANLLVEAMNFPGQSQGSGDSPATQYLKNTFQPMIKEETAMFLNCVLKLIIYNSGLYSQDAFLPGAAQDILARATFFIAQTLNEDHYGLRAGILGTANLFPVVSHGVALDTHLHRYNAGVGERVDIDIPDKPYDSWGTLIYDPVNVQKGTLYALKKYDFAPPATSSIFDTRDYVVGDDSINTTCTATVKRYTKDYIEDPNGEIVYGYCVGAARIGGTEVIMDPSVFTKNQFYVDKSAGVNYGEEDHLDFPGVLFLKTWASNKYYNDSSNISVVQEYSHDFIFGGDQETDAYLNIDGNANGTVNTGWVATCSIGINIGIFNVTQQEITAQSTLSMSNGNWNNKSLKDQVSSFKLEPGNNYYVFANVVGSGKNLLYGSYNYEVDITLTHISLTFVNKDK